LLLTKIEKDSITLKQKEDTIKTIPVDFVVLSLGVKSRNEMEQELKKTFERVYTIGDAKEIGRIAGAVHSGYKAASEIQ